MLFDHAESETCMRLSLQLVLIGDQALRQIGVKHLLDLILALPQLLCILLELIFEFFVNLFIV